jgi:amino acid transporter
LSRLRLFSLAALGFNGIVGSGIFVLPADLAKAMGASSPIAFVIGGAILAVIALAFAYCSRLVAGDGGAYLYTREALGAPVGIVVGLSVYLATVTTWSALSAAIPVQLAEIVPGADAHPRLLGTAVVLAFGAANLIGVRAGAWVSDVLVVVKLVPLVAFAVIGIFFVRSENFGPVSMHGLGAALLPAFFALSGFESAAIPAGVAERPKRDVAVAVVVSLGAAALLYVLIQLIVVGVLPGAAASKRPLIDASRVFLGDTGAGVMAALAVISMLGLAAAMALTGARLGAIGTSDRTGALVTTTIAVVGTLLVDFDKLVDYTAYLLFLQYGAVLVAAFVMAYRRRR